MYRIQKTVEAEHTSAKYQVGKYQRTAIPKWPACKRCNRVELLRTAHMISERIKQITENPR